MCASKPGSRHAARDRQLGHRRLHHRLALAARAGGPDMANDLEAAGYVLQHLCHALADLAQLGGRPLFCTVCRRVNDLTARQLGRQPSGASFYLFGAAEPAWCRRGASGASGLDRSTWLVQLPSAVAAFDLLQCQLKLLDGTLGVLQSLRRTSRDAAWQAVPSASRPPASSRSGRFWRRPASISAVRAASISSRSAISASLAISCRRSCAISE